MNVAGRIVLYFAGIFIAVARETPTVVTLGPKHAGLGSCAFDSNFNVYCTETHGHCIWKTSISTGEEIEFAGTCNKPGYADGPGTDALFTSPMGICVTPENYVIVSDSGNACIRRISPEGVVETFAGACGDPGQKDGPVDEARFNQGLKEVACLPNCSVVVDDGTAHKLRLINVPGGCHANAAPRSHRWVLWAVGGWVLSGSLVSVALWAAYSVWLTRSKLRDGLNAVVERQPIMAEERRVHFMGPDYHEGSISPRTPQPSPCSYREASEHGASDVASCLQALEQLQAANQHGQREDELIHFSSDDDDEYP
eukprot:jgi/Botrbrau1/8931/Bobra.0148s0044.1